MAYTISQELQTKIDSVKTEIERITARQANIRAHNESVQRELVQANQELQTAITTLADNPNESNRLAEKEARKKVAELEAEVNGSSQRASAVFQTNNSTLNALQKDVLKSAGQELRTNYNTQKPVVLQKIEDAKAAYLQALKELHDLTLIDTQGTYYDIAREIGSNDDNARDFEPGVSMHEPLLYWRDPGYNYLGINDLEIKSAFNRGIIEKGSIRE